MKSQLLSEKSFSKNNKEENAMTGRTRMKFAMLMVLLSAVVLFAQKSYSEEFPAVFRWDKPAYNTVGRDIVTAVRRQGMITPGCSFQSGAAVYESMLLKEHFDDFSGLNRPTDEFLISPIPAYLYDDYLWPIVTVQNFVFREWFYTGPMMQHCTGKFTPPYEELEACPRLPYYLDRDSTFLYSWAIEMADPAVGIEAAKDKVKEFLFMNGPVQLHFRKGASYNRFWDSEGVTDIDGKKYMRYPVYVENGDCTGCKHHVVQLVGWNDNIEVVDYSSFDPANICQQPIHLGNGAWLVKDSRGDVPEEVPTWDDLPPGHCHTVTDDEDYEPGFFWFAYAEHHNLIFETDKGVFKENNLDFWINGIYEDAIQEPCIVYVTEEGGAGVDPQTGESWNKAFDWEGIQDAIDLAYDLTEGEKKCEVWIAKGYYPVWETIYLRPGVRVVGGFDGNETILDMMNMNFEKQWSTGVPDPELETYIRGQEIIPYHIFIGAPDSVIDNVTIGFGHAIGDTDEDKNGGGIYTVDSMVVRNVKFYHNEAENYGGGMFTGSDYKKSLIINSLFIDNDAHSGGGLAIVTPLNIYRGHTVLAGHFYNNHARRGGGLYGEMDNYLVSNSDFIGNEADLEMGGGVFSFNTNKSALIVNTNFILNESADNGGAIANENSRFSLVNCNLADNISINNDVGAIYNFNRTNDKSIVVYNSILWQNSSEEIGGDGSYDEYITLNYNNIYNITPFDSNISEDPKWDSEHKLTDNSPCIDEGHDKDDPPYHIVPAKRDKDNWRKLNITSFEYDTGTQTDMGPYDYQEPWMHPEYNDDIRGSFGSSLRVTSILETDSNDFDIVGINDGKDHAWIITNTDEEGQTLRMTVEICPETGDAVLAFYSLTQELLDVANEGAAGECETLSITMPPNISIAVVVDTYGGSSDYLGKYRRDISWEPGYGCSVEKITDDDAADFSFYTLNDLNSAPWEYGTPGSGPGECNDPGGQCWGTNLDGNYANNANECIETEAIDLSEYESEQVIELSFMHWYNFENGYDGANVEAWDGTQWNIIDPQGGYPDLSISASGTSVHNKRGYSSEGTESEWHSQYFGIQGYSNEDFKVRFCIGTDDLYSSSGWYIDNVNIKFSDKACGSNCYDNIFMEDFNYENGLFFLDPDIQTGHSWEWGDPQGDPLTGADGKVWATNLTGDYNTPEDSCIRSPLIDLSGCRQWQDVTMSFNHWFRFWHNLLGDTWDGAQVQAWDGNEWAVIEPSGGYPDIIYAPGTSLHGEPGYTDLGDYDTWHSQTFDLTGYRNSDFQLRFCMASDYAPHPGWYIDNVSIDGPPAPNPACQSGMVLYSSDFESDNGGFTSGLWNASGNNTWAHGTATNGPGSCHGGDNCWATNLAANYADCEDGYISKSLDLSACGNGMETVYLVYWHWFEFEENTSGCDPAYYDGYTVTWSGDGQSWTQPETSSFVSGGFNTTSIEATNSGCPVTAWVDGKRGYENSSGAWVKVVVPIPAEVMTSNFELRLTAGSDGSANEAGAYVDDVCIAVGDYMACD